MLFAAAVETDFDPAEVLASETTIGRIEAVCRRKFYDPVEADECFVYILDQLQANDFKRLRSFKGRSSFKTYVYTVINSLAADFKRRKYGRKRIPKAVSKLGEWAERVYRIVCWQRYNYKDAYEITCLEGIFEGSFGKFLETVEPLRGVPCRENPSFLSVDDEEGAAPDLSDAEANPLEELLCRMDDEVRLKALAVIKKVTDELNEIDQTLVRLVYGSGKSMAAAGRAAGLKPNAARKRLKSILTRYKAGLLAEGIRNG